MSGPRLIVLKFGGSVLSCEADLANAVHEIYRWRRDGWQVIAVVSAFAGRTDALLREATAFCADPCPFAVAAHIANGEFECAAKLGLFLDRAGVPAAVLHPTASIITAEGDPLDAGVKSVSTSAIKHALAIHGAVVLPGFVAADAHGRTVVLGRGGSDLTALILAQSLQADRCRLIKDVDGLYEFNPNSVRIGSGSSRPRRFASATWQDALATDGTIVQHKAVRFAQEHGIAFELGGFNAETPTRIGTAQTRLEESPRDHSPLRVTLLGLGTVGAGVYEHLRRLESRFQIAAIAVRDINKRRDVEVPRELLTDDAVAAAASPEFDIVIELIGGTTVAKHAIEAALKRGTHVITANKALIARHGTELHQLANANGCQLRYAAAVGGSVPIIEQLSVNSANAANPPRQIRAVLNGTTNFVLNRLGSGVSFNDAVIEAQQRGFAEVDPTRDLIGLDAADKLIVLAQVLGFSDCTVDDVAREPLDHGVVDRARSLAASHRALRHVATLKRTVQGVELSVRLTAIDESDPLFHVPGEQNAAILQWEDGSEQVLRGRGAGRRPTAEAIMGDLFSHARTPSPERTRDQLRLDTEQLDGVVIAAVREEL